MFVCDFFFYLYIRFALICRVYIWSSEVRGDLVGECLTRDRGVAGSRLTGAQTCVLEPDTLSSA